MTTRARRMVAAGAVITANLICFSCSTASREPQKGTPAFYWAAARQTYATGDYPKAIENLESLVDTNNEFTLRSRPWLLIMTSGMARGYMEIADFYEAGARMHKADPTPFRKQVSKARGNANRMALQFAEAFAGMQTVKDDPVILGFACPTGSAAPVAVLAKAGNGILPQEAEMESAEKTALSRAVLLATCRAAGAPDDTAKAQELFRTGEVKVPRATFILAMANALHEEAQLYGRQKLDLPDKLKIFCDRAQEALRSIPQTKETKELDTKIKATLKRARV